MRGGGGDLCVRMQEMVELAEEDEDDEPLVGSMYDERYTSRLGSECVGPCGVVG